VTALEIMPPAMLAVLAMTGLIAIVFFGDRAETEGRPFGYWIAAFLISLAVLALLFLLYADAPLGSFWNVFLIAFLLSVVAVWIVSSCWMRYTGRGFFEGTWAYLARTRPTHWEKPYPPAINWALVPVFVIFVGFMTLSRHMRREGLSIAEFFHQFMN
jgi:hypothetical protein